MCRISVLFLLNSLILGQCVFDDRILREKQMYAAKMASYMNTDIDPCDDFYEYACGNYFKINKPKLGIRIQSALLNIENQEIDAFNKILMKSPENNQSATTAVDKVKYVYQACMRANVFNYKKSDAYLQLIESLGGWPALDPNWQPENFDWFHVMTTLKKYGVDFIITEEVRMDREYLIMLKPEIFGLVKLLRNDLNATASRAYQLNKKLAMKIMLLYGVGPVEAKKAFREVLEFGKIVAIEEWMELAMDLAGLGFQNLMTISNLTKRAPAYDWEKYFSSVAGGTVNISQSILYVPTVEVIKTLPSYFSRTEIIRGAANYAILKLLFELHNEFKSSKYPERYCFFHVQKYMSSAASLLYAQSEYHSSANEDEAWTVLTYARNAFKESIASRDWLDNDSKTRTLAKLENMKILIGYTNQTWNVDEINSEYQDLHVDQDNFYRNNLELRRRHQKLLHKFIVTNVFNRDEFIAPYLIDLNAFYNFYLNQLIIPSVLLVKPYAYPKLPKSYNFGSIGRTISHELVHGFDSTGKIYNEFAKPEIWWSNDSMAAYEEREECFEEQYSTFRIPELNININGEDSIQENIADNGGIRQSYHGYRKWLEDNKDRINEADEILPGLNLTNYQLFFLSFGQTFCTRYNSKKAYKLYIEGSYAVEKYRLLGSLLNFEEFSRHFNCKLGSRMNPKHKCVLW